MNWQENLGHMLSTFAFELSDIDNISHSSMKSDTLMVNYYHESKHPVNFVMMIHEHNTMLFAQFFKSFFCRMDFQFTSWPPVTKE